MITATINFLLSWFGVALVLTGSIALTAGLSMREESKEEKEIEQRHWRH